MRTFISVSETPTIAQFERTEEGMVWRILEASKGDVSMRELDGEKPEFLHDEFISEAIRNYDWTVV
jgi:hypothetical protein